MPWMGMAGLEEVVRGSSGASRLSLIYLGANHVSVSLNFKSATLVACQELTTASDTSHVRRVLGVEREDSEASIAAFVGGRGQCR